LDLKLGYKRVSTVDQNTDRQLFGMTFKRVFIEKVSGKDTNRPELQSLLGMLRTGDEVHVHELSRLARNTKDLLDIVQQVMNAGASIKFHKENLEFIAGETASPVQNLMLSMLGSIAQFERDLLLERQREGISLAKHRGVYQGRHSKFTTHDIERIKADFIESTNKASLAKKWGISRAYLYRLANAA